MKRISLLMAAAAVAVVLTSNVGVSTVRACQYCRMALEDPETARMITDNKGGSFPLDSSIGQYQAAAPSANLTEAPAPSSVATSATALTTPAANGTAAPVVHRPVLAPPPAPAQKAATQPASPAVKAPVAVATVNQAPNTAVAHWTDLCLFGLVAAGGVFCWRTRRTPPANF